MSSGIRLLVIFLSGFWSSVETLRAAEPPIDDLCGKMRADLDPDSGVGFSILPLAVDLTDSDVNEIRNGARYLFSTVFPERFQITFASADWTKLKEKVPKSVAKLEHLVERTKELACKGLPRGECASFVGCTLRWDGFVAMGGTTPHYDTDTYITVIHGLLGSGPVFFGKDGRVDVPSKRTVVVTGGYRQQLGKPGRTAPLHHAGDQTGGRLVLVCGFKPYGF